MASRRESAGDGYLVRGARLGLRELGVDDLDFVAAMLGEGEVMRHYPRTLDCAGAREWLERQLERQSGVRREIHASW